MEKNCYMTGEMGDHPPIKLPGEDQSSSEIPVAAKPLPNDTNWVDLFVKEITSASDSDDARIRAAKSLKSFEAFLRDCLISEVKWNLLERAKKIPLEDEAKANRDYFVTHDGEIHPFGIGGADIDSDSETDEEDDLKYKQLEERLMRVKWGIDENGRMPEHIKPYWEEFGPKGYEFGPLNKQPMDMVDGNGDKK